MIAREADAGVAPRHEAVWFTLACLTFILLEIAALRAWPMVTRPLWLDEIHTYLVAGAQTLRASMHSLAAGSDFNPPAVFLLYRAAALLAGGLSPITARIVASMCVLGALTTVYLLLRDQFSPWPAAVGTLAVWAQQVVMHAAFEARFYGPLLLASGCLLLALLRTARREPTRTSAVALALVSIVLCTVHYFGILSWWIGVGTAVLAAPTPRVTTMRRLLPSIAGPLALAACAPLYLGQRASLTVPTWIPAVTLIGLVRLLAVFLLTLPVAIALVCWAITWAQSWRSGTRAERVRGQPFSLGPILLLGQVAVPFTLAAFSLLVQPATELRYWIAGAFGAAPVVALVVSRADTAVRWIATVAMIGSSVKTMVGEGNRAELFARRVKGDVRVATELAASGTLVVARWRDTLYPVLVEKPELRSHTAVLDSTPFDTTNAFFAVERDIARVHGRIYGMPNIVTPAELGRLPSFYLMEPESESAPTAKEFPRHTMSRVADRVFYLALRPAANP